MRNRVRTSNSSNQGFLVIVSILTIAILFLSIRLIFIKPVRSSPPIDKDQDAETGDDTLNPFYKAILARSMPMNIAKNEGGGFSLVSSLWNLLFPDMGDPKNIVGYQMPYLSNNDTARSGAIHVSGRLPDRSLVDGYDNDESSYGDVSDEIKIIIEGLEPDDKPIDLTGEGAQVLIYHTHSRESYKQDPDNPYAEAAREAFRSNDFNHTVIDVGRVFAGHLTSMGIPVIHDTTDHEGNDYNGSYSKSLQTLKTRINEHESLQMFIDIHRNSYGESSKRSSSDEVVVINGDRVAKLFVVIGTGEGVMGGFNEKPDWQENAKLAIKLTNKLNEMYPGLAKDVYYKSGRFNQHMSTKAILIEVGSTYTTQKEAERATKYLAQALHDIIE